MNNTKIKIEYGQIKFEVESDAENAAKERDKFLETLPILFSLHNSTKTTKLDSKENEVNLIENDDANLIEFKPETKYENINTFLRDKGFETDIDKSLAFAYFMQEVENFEFIDSNMVKERMKKAKEAIPKNISMTFTRLTQKGYLQPSDNENSTLASYYVTGEGIEYVNNFQKKEKKSSKSVKSHQPKSLESRYDSLNKTKLNLEKYPSIVELKNTKDKIMLMMYIVKDNELGEFFTVNDIMFIMSKVFNEKITIDMVKGQFKNDATKMYYDKQLIEGNKKTYEYKLLNTGEKYVRENILNQ